MNNTNVLYKLIDEQDEWVVCRVFQKSAGGKKYPSNHSRAAINPFNLGIGPNAGMPLMASQIMQTADSSYHQFPMVAMGMGRTYMSNEELTEFSRVYRSASTSMNNMPLQTQLNYPPGVVVGSGGSVAGCFTISGLNLNLGGSTNSTQGMRAAQPPPQVMNQQDMTSSMLITSGATGNEVAYGGDHMNHNSNGMNNNNNRFMPMEQQCHDLGSYWPPY